MSLVIESSTTQSSHSSALKRCLERSDAPWEIPGHVPDSPYAVRMVRTETQMQMAIDVRYEAYSEKLQALADKVRRPGILDYTHGPVVLIAVNKLTGETVGTLRLNTGPDVLEMFADVALPENIILERVGFVSRMAVIGPVSERQLVRNLMQKAVFQLCIAKQLNRILLFAAQPRERLFYRCGFSDVFVDGEARCPTFLDGFPVKALYADTYALERLWKEQKHPLYDFLFRTFHPEIEVFSSLSSTGRRQSESARFASEAHPAETLYVT